jgi:predicted small secreted protein
MKQAKTISVIFIIVLISCSYSIGQTSNGIGKNISNSGPRPGILGMVNDGANVNPIGDVSNAKAYPDGIKTTVIISRLEFICNTISSCGIYPYGKSNNGDGAIVNLGGVKSGATVPNIDGSAVRTVSVAKAKS